MEKVLDDGLLVGILAELCEHGLGAFGVEEGDLKAVGTLAGGFVDSADTLFLAFSQSVGYTILNGECHVVHTSLATVFLDELGDSRVGGSGFEELDLGVAHLEESGGHLLVFHDFLFVALQAEYVFIVLDSLFEVRHCDADVFDV